MNRKRVNLTIDENWLKIAKKYAIDNNISLSRLFETALKKMMRVEENKKLNAEDLERFKNIILNRIDNTTEELKNYIKEQTEGNIFDNDGY